jgi:BirA family biotin operon repressor/biotin-[acetyl-CoA-carboxylase] ligase
MNDRRYPADLFFLVVLIVQIDCHDPLEFVRWFVPEFCPTVAIMERLALDQGQLRSMILDGSALWHHLELVERTGSTNADLIAGAGAERFPLGTILIAEEQLAGRGRLDRSWSAPPRSGLAVSFLIASPSELAATLVPLLVGIAAVRAIRTRAGISKPERAVLKWPNDVMIDECKVGGVLTHQIAVAGKKAIVAGLGLNILLTADELPIPSATSLQIEGARELDRSVYLAAFLREVENLLLYPETDSLIAEYTSFSSTLGREVLIELPGMKKYCGIATSIDHSGALVFADGYVVSAGDVVHLR